ncbi:MAG: tetratricopeptide repeat protein [Myxococcota bacterium]
MTAVSPRSDRWLWGPGWDLLLGCGLLYAGIFLLMLVAGPPIRAYQALYVFPILILLISTPHYGATLVRVYEQRSERRRYTLFAVWGSLAVLGLFLASLALPLVASAMVTVFLTWSPYHYTGQNYGIASLFLRRRDVTIPDSLRRVFKASFLLAYALTFIGLNIEDGNPVSTPRGISTAGVQFLSLGLPYWSFAPVLAVYLATSAAALLGLRRLAPWRDLGPALALMLSQALWFALPLTMIHYGWLPGIEALGIEYRAYYFIWVGLAHGIQYLWITSYFAKSAQAWSGIRGYWGKTLLAGVSVWALPVLLLAPIGLGGLVSVADYAPTYAGSFGLIIASGVNIHHFMLDGVIWRLRNNRIASILLRQEDPEASPEDRNTARRRWPPRLLWGLAGLVLLASVTTLYSKSFALPRALEAGDWQAAESAVRTLTRFGYDSPGQHTQVAAAAYDAGDYTDSERLFGAVVAAHPGLAIARHGLARSLEARGDTEAAIAEYFEALASQPGFAAAHFDLGNALAKKKLYDAAILHFREAIAAAPDMIAAHNNLGAGLASSGDLEAALVAYQKALELDPRNSIATRNIRGLKGALR